MNSHRFSHACVLILFIGVAAFASGCTKSPAERLVDASLAHMKAAEEMMAAADGQLEALIDAVGQYRLKHHKSFRQLRRDGEKALRAMNAEDRALLQAKAQRRGNEHMSRIDTLSKKFKQPTLALRVIRPLLIAATPRPPTGKPRDILPPVPPLPLPNGATTSGEAGGAVPSGRNLPIHPHAH